MRAFCLASLALATGFGLSAAWADTREIDTATGPVAVPAGPEKVAVFDVSVLDTLNALGVSVAGAPERIYVDYLEESVRDAEKVGSLFEPDFEAINALQPDLIIAGGRSAKQVGALSQLSPTIDMSIGTNVLADAKARLNAYGIVFNKEQKARELEADLTNAIEAVRQTTKGAGNALILLTHGPKLSIYGPDSRFGWFHSALGIEPAVETVHASNHGEAVSFEFIRDADPDWLIVIDRAAAIGQDATLAEETLNNKLVAETKAWKNGQVVYLDAGKVYIAAGGYQSMMDTIGDITRAFSKSN